MRKKLRILGFLASLVMFAFSSNAFAEYSCDRTYISCKSGYYLDSGLCKPCSDAGAGCTCAGGTAAPVCCGTKNCPSGYTDGPATYNSCNDSDGSKTCYANCTKTCSGDDTSACPDNSTCTYNTNYSTNGHKLYNGSCDAAASLCPLTSFTCNANYEKDTAGTGCVACSTKNTTETENITNGTRTRSVTYSSVAGGSCTASNGDWAYNCDSGYYLDGTTCKSCSSVTCGTNSGSVSCTDEVSCSVTDGVCTVVSATKPYTETCYYQGGAGGSNGVEQCSGSNWIRTNGTCTITGTSITCNANHYLANDACPSCPNDYPLSSSGSTSISACYRACTTSDVEGSAAVKGTVTQGGVITCEATSCDSSHCLAAGGVCVDKPTNGYCTGIPDEPLGCDSGYHLNNEKTGCDPDTYTVTYSCGTNASGSVTGGTATYGNAFTPASASGCSRANYVFAGWMVSGTSDVKSAGSAGAFIWGYLENKTFTAKWVNTVCAAGQYFDSTTTSCKSCATDAGDGYTSDAGANGINECYTTCDTESCLDPGKPANTTTTGYWFSVGRIESKQYYGGSCIPATTYCEYNNISCKSNYYLNLDIWTCSTVDGKRVCSAPASASASACVACSTLANGAFPKSDANSLSVHGGGASMCRTGDQTIACSTLLPKPTNATSCSYVDYQGTSITSINGASFYPDAELKAYTYNTNEQDATGANIYKPKGCYMSSCTCAAGYKFVAPTAGDATDPGACVPDTFTITLNDNGGSGGTGTIYEKYSVGWYSNSAATTSITSITKPTLDANHSFMGYYDAQTGGNQVIPASGVLPISTVLTANTTLYAHWSEDNFTCTAGKTHTGATCPAGSYCPGGSVAASLKDDPTSGCARTCPSDASNGTVTSATGSSLITQCKTTRTNVALSDNTGKGNQTCYYDSSAANYSKDCTIAITSCNEGRYRESETSITCAVVGKGAYSPANDIVKHLCSELDGADATVTTDGDTSAAATACYNQCSDISITNGSRKAVNAKESYDGTSIPACSYTTECNAGYAPSGETCVPRVYEITLNHDGGASSTSKVYLKYATGWYSNAAATTAITSVPLPTLAGKSCSGYFSATNQQIVDATGKLTTTYTVFTADATITASYEVKPVVNCAAGTYYIGTGTTCSDCPAGSYCPGTTPIQDTGSVSGLEACPTGAYTAAKNASGNNLTVTISSAAKSTAKSDCFATNVAYTATQGAGSQTCYYNEATSNYADRCKDKQILTCTTGHYLASASATDCVEVTAGYYSPDVVTTRTECPNRDEDSTITTQSTTSGDVAQCYRGNIWYEPAGGHSGHRRNCYHKPANGGTIDTNITTGYTYNCDVSVIVACDAGYYDDGSYKNANNERDCVKVGKGKWSPAQTACSGEDAQPSMDNPGCSTQINTCPVGTGATDVVSTTPDTATETSGSITDCYLTCNATKNLNGTVVNVVNVHPTYNTTKNAYNKCTYDSDVCPEDMWCDADGFHDCPTDRDGTVGKANLVEGQKLRGIETCYVTYNPYQQTTGYPLHKWANGTGYATCYYNGTESNGDYNNCMDANALTCNGGYYYKTAGAFGCSGTTSGYYSGNDATTQTECPVGWAGSTEFAVDYTACYTECGLTTDDIAHSKTVSAAANTVYGNSATTYNACSYNVVCHTGYDVKNNNTATPTCAAHEYTITLNKNGGTGSTAASVKCTFDSGTCALPAITDTRTGYSTANKWCTAADGTGTCYNAGTNVTTNISSDARDIELFAQWTPNVYTVTLNHNGAATAGAPSTVYLKYATGWYSNASATTAISQLTTVPVKGVLTFAGYTGNNVSVIGADGKFATTTAALTFTTANATVTAQWTDAPITCPAGKYYVGTGEDPTTACATCSADHYCGGVTVVTNSGQSGIDQCPDGGKAPAGSTSSAACYKELLPTYVATHGKGTQTCYYDEATLAYSDRCKDFAITTCDAGYYLKNTTDTDCSVVGVGYYSANLIVTRDACPNSGTTATNNTTAETVEECFKTNLDYAAIDASGTGTQSCWYSSGTGTSAVYGRDCFDKVITACRGGYYLAEPTNIVCTVVDFNYYSVENDIERHACPDDGKTSYPDTSLKAECWKNGQPYVAEHGGGERTCKWSEADSAYLAGCGIPTMLYCDAGYWLANSTDIECSVADYAYYSPDRDLMRYACPAGTTTLTQTSDSERACFICPENSVCEPGQEVETCDYLTGGLYPKSDAGTTEVAYCYKDCAVAENAKTMSGRDYYNAPDTCEIASCAQGFMLKDGQCTTCPEGSFCDGTPGDDGDGAKSCADLGDGSWMYSAAGATKPSDCYRKCVETVVDSCTLTPVEGTAYWPNNCQYTGTSATGNPAEVENGRCVETSCKPNYEMVGGVCELCNRENALSYKSDGNCVIESCVIGYHPNGDVCEENIKDCTSQAPNATAAEQKWDATRKAFGVCMIKSCEEDYHLASNACVPNEQVCNIANGVGTRTWNTTTNSWNACVATSCVPGYTNDPYEKNNASEQCSECRNKFSVLGEVAAASYSTGCEIASCLYQGEKYNLDNNECVPICAQPYSDETGSLRWNNATKKCERTCNPGYISW